MSDSGKKKDVLVTGASGVIGASIARRLATAGFNLHLTSRQATRLAPLRQELSTASAKVEIYEGDLLEVAQCIRIVDEFFRRAQQPFGLVCNAGDLGLLGLFLQVSFAEWSQAMQKNFLGHAAMIHEFGRRFMSDGRKGGAVVLLSGAGLGSAVTHTNLSSYGTAKAAVTYLAEGLAAEFKELDITINAVAPGQVKSGITEQAIKAGVEQAGAYALAARECEKSGGVSPDLSAQLVEFLMSPAARKVTGRLLSARFDQERLRKDAETISEDPDLYRLRRIDNDLFSKRR